MEWNLTPYKRGLHATLRSQALPTIQDTVVTKATPCSLWHRLLYPCPSRRGRRGGGPYPTSSPPDLTSPSLLIFPSMVGFCTGCLRGPPDTEKSGPSLAPGFPMRATPRLSLPLQKGAKGRCHCSILGQQGTDQRRVHWFGFWERRGIARDFFTGVVASRHTGVAATGRQP